MEDIAKRKEQMSQFFQYAMRYGLYLGLFFVFTFLWFIVAFYINIFSLQISIFIPFFAIPVLVYFYGKKMREQVFGGEIRFSLAWNFGTLLFFFAGLILAFTMYIVIEYIVPGLFPQIQTNISNALNEILKEASANNMSQQQISLIQEQIRMLNELLLRSAIEVAVDNLWNCIFWGIIVSLPIAFLLKKQKKEDKHL